LAKNLFLSTSKNLLRKLHEALLTLELEAILGKRRILEIYLNVIEWGDGIYGAEAAARYYFNASASSLSPEQAAFLSAIIPNPRETYNPAKHPRRVERRRNRILRLMRHIVIPKDLD
jgi:monofunctional biosynthetic peptidoglycan transglycosylase